ncbi:MAG TPA: hypothetical protein VGX92_18870 [Pyrinomonadaceae bacterium]|jgi:hypothetical protein|nr:hypothetical protein [Pyrinomonadaceae bacterium]
MPKELKGEDGITWTCVQAYSGLSDKPENEEAARVEGGAGRVRVVCTPSGGARSVRLELPEDWESSLDDEKLLRKIEEHRET